MSNLQARLGLVAPNTPFTQTDYWRLGASGARTIVLLWPDHSRADAEVCHALGMTVWVRLPGEGRPQVADAQRAIAEFAGVAHGLLLGNEPAVSDLWDHAWYMNEVLDECGDAARAAGLVWGAPGWRSPLPPPVEGAVLADLPAVTVDAALAERLRTVYGRCDVLGVHAYSAWNLTDAAVLARVDAWHAWLPDLPVLLSEVGIAGRWPLGPGDHDEGRNDAERVRRFVAFLAVLSPYVTAACLFLLGGDISWTAFSTPGTYDPAGGNRYAYCAPAWALLGMIVRTP